MSTKPLLLKTGISRLKIFRLKKSLKIFYKLICFSFWNHLKLQVESEVEKNQRLLFSSVTKR